MPRALGGLTPTYTVKRTKTLANKSYFEICKFLEDPLPSDEYTVTFGSNGIWCSCLGFRRMNGDKNFHKHILLVRLWLQRGEKAGEVFQIDDAGNPKYFHSIL